MKIEDANTPELRLEYVASVIESLNTATLDDLIENDVSLITNTFWMGNESFACGSPACIIGWYEHIFPTQSLSIDVRDIRREHYPDDVYLSDDEIREPMATLTCPTVGKYDFTRSPECTGYITAKHAAACIRHFIESGIVDWSQSDPSNK